MACNSEFIAVDTIKLVLTNTNILATLTRDGGDQQCKSQPPTVAVAGKWVPMHTRHATSPLLYYYVPPITNVHRQQQQQQPYSSDAKVIGGMSWRFEVYKKFVKGKHNTANSFSLVMFIYCKETDSKDKEDNLWLTKVKFSTTAGYNNYQRVKRDHGSFYGFNTYYWTFDNIYEPFTNNYDYGPLDIELCINVAHAAQANLPPLDSNLEIKIGAGTSSKTTIVAVNKHSLAALSNYFRNLFFVDWKEQQRQQQNRGAAAVHRITEEDADFDLDAFRWMLYASIALGWAVSESNFLNSNYSLCVKILKMAVKYDLPPLVDYCEKFLSGVITEQPKMALLDLAEYYSLERLKDQCLRQIGSVDFMKNFVQSQQIYAQLSTATKERLNAKMMAI